MSTILKSLKKLEDEKSVLDKSIDLQSLVIQREPVESAWHLPSPQQILAITAVVATGLVLAGLWVAGVFESKPAPVQQATAIVPVPAPQKNNVPRRPVYEGIALASIPSVSPPVPSLPKQTAKKPKRPQSVPSTLQETKPVQKTPPQAPATNPELPEAQPLRETPRNTEDRVAPEPRSIVTGRLPGFTLRGVIYFGEDSPFNYIFYSTAQEKNKKLKAGEAIFGATLKKIKPDSAVFAHQGQLIQIPIGQPLQDRP